VPDLRVVLEADFRKGCGDLFVHGAVPHLRHGPEVSRKWLSMEKTGSKQLMGFCITMEIAEPRRAFMVSGLSCGHLWRSFVKTVP
jgi:hypothetical protein